MGLIEHKLPDNILTTQVDAIINWARKSALWPMTFGLACCAFEMIASAMGRGEVEIVPRPDGMPDSLKGTGDFRTMWRYLPRVSARNIKVPTLIIDQQEEEYGGCENSGLAAKKAIPETTIVKYHVFPGTHYDVYDKNYKESAKMARAWFVEHLQN